MTWKKKNNGEWQVSLSAEIDPDCVKCFLEQAKKLIARYRIPDAVAKNIITRLQSYVIVHSGLTSPEVSCLMHRYFKSATGIKDPYSEEKKAYNDLLLNLETAIRNVIQESGNPFQAALRYALAGNIIDFGPQKPFNIFRTLSAAVSHEPDIDHSLELKTELGKASKVLYLGDNAGEIVLDKLFIETIKHPELYFAVRGNNVMNDITTEDAVIVGIPKVASVISNGYGAPSTIVNRCSSEFQEIYNASDVIISKGQGNLEGLIHVRDKKIFFLLMIKCNVIATRLGVQEKSVVVLYNRKIKAPGLESRDALSRH